MRPLPGLDVPIAAPQTGLVTQAYYEYFQDTIQSNRIRGTATSDSAAAGLLGELLSSGPTSQALTTATPANITSLLLTAGDWELSAPIQFNGAGGTTTTDLQASINTVSATLDLTLGRSGHWRGSTVDLYFPMVLGPLRVSLSTSTTYFLVAQAAFTGSTFGATGALHARRAR